VPYIFLTAAAFVAVLYQQATVDDLAKAPRTQALAPAGGALPTGGALSA
jgi:hypothetical protein